MIVSTGLDLNAAFDPTPLEYLEGTPITSEVRSVPKFKMPCQNHGGLMSTSPGLSTAV